MKNIKYGFTLIEVLVVIAIIAVLVGILLPVFSTVKAQSRKANCATNLMEIGTSISMYCADFDQRMIPCVSFANYASKNEGFPGDQQMTGYSFAGSQVDNCWAWSTILFPYVKNKNTYYCPGSIIEPNQVLLDTSDGQILASTYNTGYAINCNITGGRINSLVKTNGVVTRVRPPLLNQLRSPAETCLVADGSSCGLFGTVINKYVVNDQCYIPASYQNKESAEAAGLTGDFIDDGVDRHTAGRIMVLYADNHVDVLYSSKLLQEMNNSSSVILNGGF